MTDEETRSSNATSVANEIGVSAEASHKLDLPTVSEARSKYDRLALENDTKAGEYSRWKKEQVAKKQQEEVKIKREFGHLSPETRRRSIEQHQTAKNIEAQLHVERQYMKNAVGTVTFSSPDHPPKTVIIPGVNPKVGPQVALLSKELNLKTPEQLQLLEQKEMSASECLETTSEESMSESEEEYW